MVRPQVVASEKRDYPEIAPMHKVGKWNYIKQVDCSVLLNIAPTDRSRLMAWRRSLRQALITTVSLYQPANVAQ
eukprot:1682182-Heterocapsa_arctica.AAC.1